MKTITLTRPDDWHLHFRDNNVLSSVVADTARRFARAIIMPNLSPPVTTTDQALAYRQRIIKAIPGQLVFKPLMTLYLTDNTAATEITKAVASGHIYGVKWYPAGATTNAASGVTDIHNCETVLATMQELDLPLLVHAEVTDPEIDVFDREAVFIQCHLQPVIEKFPRLRVIFEHITTQDAVKFIEQASPQVAATITAHHLLLNRNHLFNGGLRPHHYCLPLLKREQHRQALVKAATSGNPKFFLGTDSAPHPRDAKESACGCAGIYTAHAAIELYAEVFEQADALDKLEAFSSFHGPDFYHLPRNQETITLQKQAWQVPAEFKLGDKTCVPFRAGEIVEWRLLS
ncbi:MAG: dihydroorotase [Xanthomonadales bacterium]|nr:dihydroorotase [Xanthomonadales bacterium]